jgi:hypothetical protein
MPRLPARFAAVILCFARLFGERSWRHAEMLLIPQSLANLAPLSASRSCHHPIVNTASLAIRGHAIERAG